jgi:hypothetical protein
MCQTKLGFVEKQIVGDSSDYRLRVVGPWMVLFGGSVLGTSLDLRALETNLGVKVGWRTAAVQTDQPDAWESLGTARTANGTHLEAFDTSGKTSQLFVQAAIVTALTSGATPKTAWSRLWTTVRDAGWIVGRQRIQIQPSSGNIIVPIGQPFPSAGVSALLFGFVFTGVSGTISSPACVWRSFDSGDPRMPNAWSSALTTLSNVTTDSNVNSGTLSITTTGKIMAQPGFKYSTSGTDPNGVVDVVVAAKM